jgi:hypothetical protein
LAGLLEARVASEFNAESARHFFSRLLITSVVSAAKRKPTG